MEKQTMTNPNPSIKEQIESEARKRWYYGNADDIVKRGIFVEGADYAKTLYESRVQDLEKVNDHLDEGCNERDKRIQELEKEIDKCRSLLQKMVTDTNYTQVQETYDQITEYINYINSQK